MAFEGSGPPPSVVVDANLLYPFHLRNLLVQFGVDSVIAPRWTTRINAEWIGNGVVRLASESLPWREVGLACYAATVLVTSRQTRKAASRASRCW